MFYKNIFIVGVGIILLTVISCSTSEVKSSRTAAEITGGEQRTATSEKPQEVSREEKKQMARDKLQEREEFRKMLEASRMIYADGALPKKTKQLIALGISITSDCESFIRGHVKAAARDGATEEEVYEAIMVAIDMGGGPAEISSHIAVETIQEVYKK